MILEYFILHQFFSIYLAQNKRKNITILQIYILYVIIQKTKKALIYKAFFLIYLLRRFSGIRAALPCKARK